MNRFVEANKWSPNPWIWFEPLGRETLAVRFKVMLMVLKYNVSFCVHRNTQFLKYYYFLIYMLGWNTENAHWAKNLPKRVMVNSKRLHSEIHSGLNALRIADTTQNA